jgi:hypothetical protein
MTGDSSKRATSRRLSAPSRVVKTGARHTSRAFLKAAAALRGGTRSSSINWIGTVWGISEYTGGLVGVVERSGKTWTRAKKVPCPFWHRVPSFVYSKVNLS